MTGSVWAFVAKFVVVSVALTWVWVEWGRQLYGRFFVAVTNPIYGWFDVTTFQGGVRERYINYIPFLVLMLVTPRIGWKRRTLGTLVGLVLIFFFHVGFNVWVEVAYPLDGTTTPGGFPVYLPAILFSDALPLILWAVICREFVGGVTTRAFERWGGSKRD